MPFCSDYLEIFQQLQQSHNEIKLKELESKIIPEAKEFIALTHNDYDFTGTVNVMQFAHLSTLGELYQSPAIDMSAAYEANSNKALAALKAGKYLKFLLIALLRHRQH